MGIVYRAHDPELDRLVALKLVRFGGARSPDASEARARLLREARALAKLSHPNVVQVHDVGRHGVDVFIAMELVDGTDLGKWLAQRGDSRSPACRISRVNGSVARSGARGDDLEE